MSRKSTPLPGGKQLQLGVVSENPSEEVNFGDFLTHQIITTNAIRRERASIHVVSVDLVKNSVATLERYLKLPGRSLNLATRSRCDQAVDRPFLGVTTHGSRLCPSLRQKPSTKRTITIASNRNSDCYRRMTNPTTTTAPQLCPYPQPRNHNDVMENVSG